MKHLKKFVVYGLYQESFDLTRDIILAATPEDAIAESCDARRESTTWEALEACSVNDEVAYLGAAQKKGKARVARDWEKYRNEVLSPRIVDPVRVPMPEVISVPPDMNTLITEVVEAPPLLAASPLYAVPPPAGMILRSTLLTPLGVRSEYTVMADDGEMVNVLREDEISSWIAPGGTVLREEEVLAA